MSADFPHRVQSNARRRPKKDKVDLSTCADPLLLQAESVSQHNAASAYMSGPKNVQHVCPRSVLDPSQPENPVCESCRPPNALSAQVSSSCTLPVELGSSGQPFILSHVHVFRLAETYEIVPLKQLAQDKFENSISCSPVSSELPQAIEEVYCAVFDSERRLRNAILQAFERRPGLARLECVRQVIWRTPSFALDLFKIELGLPPSVPVTVGGDRDEGVPLIQISALWLWRCS
jgi:hypothetical protein